MSSLSGPRRISGWERAFSRSIPASGDRSRGSGEAERPWLRLWRAQDDALDEYDRRHGLPDAGREERVHEFDGVVWEQAVLCEYVEHAPPTNAGGAVTECAYCRMAALALIVDGRWFLRQSVQVLGELAEHLGLPERTSVDPLVAFRAACELADDVAVLRALDRWEASRG